MKPPIHSVEKILLTWYLLPLQVIFAFSPSSIYLFVDTQTAEWCSPRWEIEYPGD